MPRWLRSTAGLIPWSGLWLWKAKMILTDLKNLAGVAEPGTSGNSMIVSAKEKPDLIIFDPPYFDKKAGDYDEKSISGLSKKAYLDFLEEFFVFSW